VLRVHDFRQLWYADTISQFGSRLTELALPVLAVTVLAANEFEMGLLATFEFLAFLVVGLPAGAWVDRWRKKRVLVAGDVLRAIALASLPLAWWLGVLTLVQVLVVALVVGTCRVFFDVAYQSYLPDLVEPDRIGEGNAALQVPESVAMIGGPALAGGAIRLIGAPFTIGLDALSFLGSALFLGRIRRRDEPPSRANRRPLRAEIGEGLRFVFGHPLLWRITACTATANFFSAMTGAMLVLFCLNDLHLDVGLIGVAMGLGAVGGLAGALATPHVNDWIGEGRTIPVTSLVWIPAGVLMPLAGTVIPPLVALVASSVLATFAVVVYNVTQVSFRQRLCPRPLLGRMNASIRFVVWGSMPLGGFLGGVVGQAYGARTVFWVAAVGSLLACLPVLFSPLIRMRDLPKELDLLS
jgi:MFS family permease